MKQWLFERWEFWCAGRAGAPLAALRAEFAASVLCVLGAVYYALETLYVWRVDEDVESFSESFVWAAEILSGGSGGSAPLSWASIFSFGYLFLIPVLFVYGGILRTKGNAVHQAIGVFAGALLLLVAAWGFYALPAGDGDDYHNLISVRSEWIKGVSFWYFARFNLFNLFFRRFLLKQPEVPEASKWWRFHSDSNFLNNFFDWGINGLNFFYFMLLMLALFRLFFAVL